MITPSHLIYNWFLLGKSPKNTDTKIATKRTYAVIAGSVFPDLPMYLFFVIYGLILATPHKEMWDNLYFFSNWNYLFTVAHSFILWPAIVGIAYVYKKTGTFWFASSALLHSIFDFLVHHDDAYRHFWPVSNWLWRSPISYWDNHYYGHIVGNIDTFVVFILIIFIYQRYKHLQIRRALIILGFLYLVSFIRSIINFYV